MRIVGVTLAVSLLGSTLMAADAGEKKEVVAAVDRLFHGMATRSAEEIGASFTADAKIVADQGGKLSPVITGEDFIKRISGGQNEVVERMWNPTVLVRGRIATVWADYDVYVNGKFGHCGIDAFMLVKTEEGWKISDVTYTSETQNCKPNPLGPVTAKH